jgi:hypothetical protein
MGFYYGSSQPPDDDPKPGSWGETIAIIIAVFRTLALPLGLLFGSIFGLLFLIWAFTISGWLGLALVGIGVGALVGYGIWESKHPPEIL